MRICAVIITYNPDHGEVEGNISRFIDGVDHLIVWDNTPAGSGVGPVGLEAFGGKAVAAGGEGNAGISRALNYAARYAMDHGYTHLLTMDQDSAWENFDAFRNFAESRGNGNIYIPRIPEKCAPGSFQEARIHFNSGALYPVEVLRRVGKFNEDYFVDMIDLDYSLRCREAGIRILQFNGCRLHHSLGYKRLVKGHCINQYSPARLYDISRNNLKFMRSHRSREAFAWGVHNYRELVLKRAWQILMYEDGKAGKLGAIIRGVASGLFGRLHKPGDW